MKAILSHPYSGALYWWFTRLQGGRIAEEDPPAHGYYRMLYRNARRDIDVALACVVIFEEIVLPAADAPFPGHGGDGAGYSQELSLAADWDHVHDARRLLEPIEADLLGDLVVKQVLASSTPDASERSMELHYAVADVLIAQRECAPVICSTGRERHVGRLLELGIFDGETTAIANAGTTVGHGLVQTVEDYCRIAGLRFQGRSISAIGEVKGQDKVRRYAGAFQKHLLSPDGASSADLLDSIGEAWEAADLQDDLVGTFTGFSRGLSVVGLIPVAGTLTSLLGLGSDLVADWAGSRGEAHRWFELGPEIARTESLLGIEEALRRDGQ